MGVVILRDGDRDSAWGVIVILRGRDRDSA